MPRRKLLSLDYEWSMLLDLKIIKHLEGLDTSKF